MPKNTGERLSKRESIVDVIMLDWSGEEFLMIPTISFIGSSGSGKTTLLEKCIGLKKRGIRVAVIKHAPHDDIGFDKVVRMIKSYIQRPTEVVIVSSQQEIALMKKTGP